MTGIVLRASEAPLFDLWPYFAIALFLLVVLYVVLCWVDSR